MRELTWNKTHKSSSKNSVSIHRNRVQWKPSSLNSIFMSRPSHPPDEITWGTELEIEPTRLDFRKWSPALHVLPWVPTGDLFALCSSHYISDRALSTPVHFLAPLNLTPFSTQSSLSTLHLSLHYSQIEHSLHYTHLTQHFRYTIFYLLVFFFFFFLLV